MGRGGGTAWWNRLPPSGWAAGPWSCRAASPRRELPGEPWGTCTPTPTRCAPRSTRRTGLSCSLATPTAVCSSPTPRRATEKSSTWATWPPWCPSATRRSRAPAGGGALERLTRQPLAVFGQAPRAVAWREKPSTYVVCAEDRATPPEAQRGYARRAGKVVELPTGHHPMLSHPELLARVIAEAAVPGG